jgi:hypothetical protein
MSIYTHVPHPRIRQRQKEKPAQTTDERVGLNGRIGLRITLIVGTMVTAYIFTGLALVSLPSVIRTGDTVAIVAWIAQTFLQLVLLPIIIVGQNIQGRTADKRAVQTYQDAEAILHECMELQAHLQAQDEVLMRIIAKAGGAPAS